MPCTNGVQALAYNQAARTFTPLWQGPIDAFGPPIVSAGLVWDVAPAASAAAARSSTASNRRPAKRATPRRSRAPSPTTSHSGARRTAAHLERLNGAAYQIMKLSSGSGFGSLVGRGRRRGVELQTRLGGRCRERERERRVAARHVVAPSPLLLHTRLKADKRGRVRLTLRCSAVSGSCRGTVTLRAKVVQIAARASWVRRVVYIARTRRLQTRQEPSS